MDSHMRDSSVLPSDYADEWTSIILSSGTNSMNNRRFKCVRRGGTVVSVCICFHWLHWDCRPSVKRRGQTTCMSCHKRFVCMLVWHSRCLTRNSDLWVEKTSQNHMIKVKHMYSNKPYMDLVLFWCYERSQSHYVCFECSHTPVWVYTRTEHMPTCFQYMR